MRKFFKGMDISSLPELLDLGEKFYTPEGIEQEPMELLKNYGVNSIRLRIWNEPQLVPEAKGYCDLKHTLFMARKLKEKDMHFLLDFHYSDYWADPGQQNKPNSWKDLSFPELTKAVYDFTYEVLSALKEENLQPDIVQVGNEIRSGMLFPDGAVPNYDKLAALLNAGIKACRDVSPDITVMIHLDQGGRFYYLKEWFDAVFAAGLLPIDAIGISFYSFWHGTFMDLQSSMTQLLERYKLPVYVVENAHPWRHCDGEHVSKDLMATAGLPAGVAEQKRVLEMVMQIADSVSQKASLRDGKDYDTGVYYWEPLIVPGYGHGSWDEQMGMFDTDGKALEGIYVYRDFEMGQTPVLNLQEYMEGLYKVDESTLPPAGTNLIPNGDFAEGTEGFWTILAPNEQAVEVRVSDKEIYVSSKENFVYQLFRDITISQAGNYTLSIDYRGTNTTGVKVTLFLKVITCNGEEMFTKEIFPSDVTFVTHELKNLALPQGTVQLGIRIDSPPVFGRFRNLRLIKEN